MMASCRLEKQISNTSLIRNAGCTSTQANFEDSCKYLSKGFAEMGIFHLNSNERCLGSS